jgi:hypothetical protein
MLDKMLLGGKIRMKTADVGGDWADEDLEIVDVNNVMEKWRYY